ncbi:unnamed protein product [Oikopleura dioica]|uniref:Uncharacterized protein n=1 Tax=Oikopleura dioica TaxID=34765 RepID=E4YYQ6_OIKDI|nr:unnamed protein product [Oikopleura dioica]
MKDRRRSRSRERRRRHRRRRSSSSNSDIASDVYSKMLSKQKRSEKNYGDTDLRIKEREEMERLRQIRQQEQNEIHIKQEVDKRVALEVGLKVEAEIARLMPEIEKKIANKIRSEQPAPSSVGDNNLNREQVELINELKHREVKHVDHIHKLEKEIADMKQRVTDAEEKLAEERLSVVESRRKLEEERTSFLKEMESKTKAQQNVILGKKNSSGVKSRPKITFGIKAKL